MIPVRAILSFALLSMTAPSSLFAEPPPLIPMRDFFRNPVEEGHNLSPSGKYIGFLKPWENRMNIHVREIGKDEVVRVTGVTERDIPMFLWASDDRLVYSLDKGGDENFHMFAINRNGTGQMDLTPHENTRAGLVNPLKYDPKHMLISHNKRDKRVFDVFKVNVETGEAGLVVENPGNITSFVADHDGKVRAATTSDGVNSSLLYRETELDPFKVILTTSFRETVDPLFFSYDNRHLYASSNLKRDTRAIVRIDPVTAQELEVLYEHPQVDVSGLLRSDKRKVVTGVSFVAAKSAHSFWDAERREIQEFLEARLPGVEVSLAGSNLDEDKYLVRTYSDKTRGAFYFYDHKARTVRHLTEISPWLNESNLADVRPICYQSRDGLFIHGYLTLPKGVDAKSLPAVILPHGGPWARDNWGFNPSVQFLANRGYAVLQMNFRGSTGYGRKFWEASFKQWGKTMQDDVTDGVKWLVDQGIADPKRVGIFGGSYGGYVVLAGLAFTPDLYACGVDYVGVANLFTILETIPPYWEPRRQMMYEMMGHPEKDQELMRAASPVFHSEKIKVPLFIAQGANDPRVKKAESDQVVEAMKKRGIDVPYMVKDNEGHGFRNEENRFDFYRAMEQFFAEHLKGRLEPGQDILGKL